MTALNTTTHCTVHEEFQNGNFFVVQHSQRAFSCMALDQSQEQCNKCIKGDGGIVGLTEGPVHSVDGC